MTAITTLIPAFKKEYLPDVLHGLICQSFKDFRVIISDDSSYGEISELINSEALARLASMLDLSIVKGPQKGASANFKYLLELWGAKTPFAHLHLDDDIIFPDFYATHIHAHSSGDYCISATPRWLSTSSGKLVTSFPEPKALKIANQHALQVDHAFLITSSVFNADNWVGEFSNILLSQSAGQQFYGESAPDFANYGWGPKDISTILRSTLEKPMIWIREHQGAFRRNEFQSTLNLSRKGKWSVHMCWITYAISAWRRGIATNEQLINGIVSIVNKRGRHLLGDPLLDEFINVLNETRGDPMKISLAAEEFWAESIQPIKNGELDQSKSRHA